MSGIFASDLAGLDNFRKGAKWSRLVSACLLGIVAGLIVTLRAQGAIPPSIAEIYDPTSAHPMPYRLYYPDGYETSNKKYPLILALHGSGERGDNNTDQFTNLGELVFKAEDDPYKAFVLTPQLTRDPAAGGWNPNSVYDRTSEILNEVLASYPVDLNRIYITGISMGGFGTFAYMAAYPNLFAAAAPIAGGGNPSTAPLIKDIPTWIFHGSADTTVSPQNSRNMYAAMLAAGGSPKYTEFPRVGHPAWILTYSDKQLVGAHFEPLGFYDWMFAQTKAVPEPSSLAMALAGGSALAAMAFRRRLRKQVGDKGKLALRAKPGSPA